jgi:hypothetical protein
MAIERKLIGRINHKGHVIEARFMGPDLIGYIDGMEMGNFYLDAQAVYKVAINQIDEEERKKK